MRKLLASVVMGIFLVSTLFTNVVFAEQNTGSFKDKINQQYNSRTAKQLKWSLSLKQTPFNRTQIHKFSASQAAPEPLFEVEPNDFPGMEDELPLGVPMIGDFDYDDYDLYKVKTTTTEPLVVFGNPLDDYPMMELVYLLMDKDLNYIEMADYGYVEDISYQLYLIPPGEYYVLAGDYFNLGSKEPYMLYADMIDTTPPAAPKVNPVDDNDTFITGKAEPNAVITAKNGNALLGKSTVDSKGNFKLSIKPIKAGAKLTFTATDASGNVSNPVTVTVADKTAPPPPKVNQVADNHTSISGKAEAGAVVAVKNGSKVLGTPKADKAGNFKLSIKPIKAGTKLTFTAKDAAGNVNKVTTITVVDKTPPVLSVKDFYSSSTQVSGKSESGAKITIKVGKTVLGTATANAKGDFKVTIKRQKKGTSVTVTAADKAKNIRTVVKKVK